MYIAFVIFLILALIITFYCFNKELFSPPVMMVLVFLFCSIVVLARYNDWKVEQYSSGSVLVLLLGIGSFILGGTIAFYLTSKICIGTPRFNTVDQDNIRECIFIPGIIGFLGVIVCIIESYLFYKYVVNTVLSMNYKHTNLSAILVSYRWASMQNLIPRDLYMPGYLAFLKYFIESLSVFALYVVIHNVIFKCFTKGDILQIIIVLGLPINAFLSSSRGDILILLAEAIYLIYLFLGVKVGFNVISNIEVIKKGIKIFVCFLVFFVVFSIFQNRIGEHNSIFNALTIYIGGGIRSFDEFIKNPLPRNQGLIGNDETLKYISTFMSIHRGQGQKTLLPLGFSYINGKSIGNIYTAFRRYYSDFRIPGVIIFSSVLGLIMTHLYCKSRRACSFEENSFVVLAFAYLSKPVFFMAIEDIFYVSNVSLNGLCKLILLYILYKIFIQKKKKRTIFTIRRGK